MSSLIDKNAFMAPFERTDLLDAILVVDDDELILTALDATLKGESLRVIKARTGQEALQCLKQQKIAVIICDQRMPEISGLEILQRAQELQPEAIRIALTGNNERETVIKAINIGQVSQFISKPWEEIVLRQIVGECLQKYRLFQENKNLHLKVLSQNAELERANQTLRYEMLLGARIHEELLLGKVPRDIEGLSIAAATLPSKEVDGDFFDFYHPLPHIVDMVIGDVMGKGIPAALVGTAVKTQLLRFAVPLNHMKYCDKNTFWQDDLFTPEEVLTRTHAEIAPQLIELEFFVSLFYGRFDLRKKHFCFVDCGSTKPMHFRVQDQSVRFLKGCDFPLGMVRENDYHEFSTPFEDGDLFIFYSDGVTESRSPEGELFGTERLASLVQEHGHKNAEELLQIIQENVLSFAQKSRFDDDLTLLVVQIQKDGGFASLDTMQVSYLNDLSELNSLRHFVKRVCGNAPGDAHALQQMLELALDEAFCNIVKHGRLDPESQIIHVRVQYHKDGIWMELSDQGERFDPQDIPEPSFVEERESGYGLFLIRRLTDKLAYLPKKGPGGWNHLRFFKRYIIKEVPMEFNHSTQDKVLVVTPTGPSLDAREAREFKEKVIDLINKNETHSIVIDMRNLQFIDSSGLGTFLSILKTLHAQNGELKLSNLSKPIRTIFELVSMHKIFEIYNSVEEAVASFK